MSIGKSDPPPAPDYASAANATAQGNLQNAREAVRNNRFNESNPYGQISWTTDGNGNWSRNTLLTGDQQRLVDLQGGLQTSLGESLRNSGLMTELMQGNGAATQKLADSLYGTATRYYDQNFARDQGGLEAKLSNMGLARGSEAWNNEMAQFNQRKDSAYADAAQRAYTTAAGQANTNQNSAVQRFMTMMGGVNPTLPQSNNTGQMPVVGAADQMAAQQASYNAAMQGVNAQNAQTGNTVQAGATIAAAFI